MTVQLDRRLFLVGSGAGLMLGLAGCGPRESSARAATAAVVPSELNLWVAVAPDGIVTIRLNSSDIGQGAQTGIAQVVADELDADWSKIRIEMAPVVKKYITKGGDGYYTGGSSSVGEQFEMFAKAGATARAMLIAAAARQWKVAANECGASNGVVTHAQSSKSMDYGALANAAAAMPVPQDVSLKNAAARRYVGKAMPRLDIPEKVDGRAQYGIDFKLDGMLTATIAQCPWFGGTLKSVDEKPALAIRGVERVLKMPDAVAVVAKNFWTAKKGLDALRPEWAKPADALASDDAMYATLRQHIGDADSFVGTLNPDTKDATVALVAKTLAQSKRTLEAEYQVQLLAHAPMEPMNATARVTADTCELWAPMQSQGDMLKDVSAALGFKPEQVVLHTTRCGGGFGRRLKTDYGVQAALIARAVGKPVKLLWTREEDFGHDFYRPASVARVKAALRDDWTIDAIDYTGATSNDTAVGGFARNYKVGAAVIRQKNTKLQFPIGAWRSVDPSITVFLIESFVDEVAHQAKLDPLAYRQRLLAGDERHLRVLNTAAQMAGWGTPKTGRAQGIAFFNSAYWDTAVAHVVELSVSPDSRITLHKVYTAIDPGLAVNPNQVRAQVEGGVILGLSAALTEGITIADGRVEQTNFDSYTVPRLASIPQIDITILQTEGVKPGGIGEPPVPPIMPALTNAVFAATGKRIRTLPLAKSGFTL